jgi:hypothetical protein
MRTLAVACLWLLGLLPAAAAQESFTDADFDFRAKLPVGMRAASDEERAALFKLEPDKARNVPRGEAAGAAVAHTYIWIDDTTPYNRQIFLALSDGLPPFKSPTELKNSQVKEGLSVDVEKLLPQPPNTAYIEGTFLRDVDKLPMRRILLYIPDFGAKRYAIMTLQAFAADWDIVKPDFDEVVANVRMKLTKQDVGRAPIAGGKGGGKGAGKAGGAGRRGPDTNSWSSLPVAGSLLLAAIVIGSLAFGRRKPA